MKQAYQLTIIGLIALALAPIARAQDVHPETPSGAEEEEQLQTTEQQDQATQQGQQHEEEEPDNGPKRIWRKSTIFFDQGVSLWTVTHDGYTFDPTSSTLIRFQPRVYLDDNTFIRLRQDLSIEETASDTTTYNAQPMFGDGLLDLMRSDLVKVGDFSFSAGGRVTIPWSIASQANRTFFGLGGVVDATYTWPHALEGFSLSFDAFVNYYFSDTSNVHSEHNYPCSRAAPAGTDPSGLNGTCDLAYSQGTLSASPTTTVFSMLFGPIASLTMTKELNLSLIIFSWANLGRNTGTDVVMLPTGPVSVGDTSPTHWRNEEVFYASLTYTFTKWFDLSLNYYAFTGFLDPSGNWRVPLYGPDQQISLTAFFTLDQLYNAVTGETHDPNRANRSRAMLRAAGGL